MNQPLDNFFREKLEHAHKPAPPAAWDRIDAGLERKQRKGLWLKIAASVLVVAAGSFILWPGHDDTAPQQVAIQSKKKIVTPAPKQQDLQPATSPASAPPAVAMTPPPAMTTTTVDRHQVKRSTTVGSPQTNQPGVPTPDQQSMAYKEPQVSQVTAVEPESIAQVQYTVVPASVTPAEATTDEVDENEQAVTLVYSASEIDEKYLDKEALAKATSSQKKPSTFRKLLDKAYDLKNNQDPMGGLRQKKNEILALSFKNEKRSQNK